MRIQTDVRQDVINSGQRTADRILLSVVRVRLGHHLLNELGHGQVGDAVDLTKLGGGLGTDHLSASLQLLGVVHLPAPHHQLGLEGPGQGLVDILRLPPPGRGNGRPGLAAGGLVVNSDLDCTEQ